MCVEWNEDLTASCIILCVCRYVNYFIERVDILLRNGITPYVVFDGGPLPMKKGTEVERRACVGSCYYCVFVSVVVPIECFAITR